MPVWSAFATLCLLAASADALNASLCSLNFTCAGSELNVTFPSVGKPTKCGSEVDLATAADKPLVVWSEGWRGCTPPLEFGHYTVMMIDADAPGGQGSPDTSASPYRHWVAVNIPCQDIRPRSGARTDAVPPGNITRGRVLLDFHGPAPPAGAHRYGIFLFKQPEEDMEFKDLSASSASSWNVTAFIDAYRLRKASSFYFVAAKSNFQLYAIIGGAIVVFFLIVLGLRCVGVCGGGSSKTPLAKAPGKYEPQS